MTANRFRLSRIASLVLLFSALVAGCSSPETKAATASERAVVATASGDLPTARDAWLEATRARDDVADYWSALGRVQLALNNYPGAYDAFARAVELNRADAASLQALAELSLPLNRGSEADDLGRQLELLAPGTVAPPTIRGFAALRLSNYRAALGYADAVFALSPDDLGATIMKARALIGLGRTDEGISLLETYARAHPQGIQAEQALQTLQAVYATIDNTQGLAQVRRRLYELAPDDVGRAIDLAASLYATGAAEGARRVTTRLAAGTLSDDRLLTILRLWLRYEDRATALANIEQWTEPATRSGAINRARFLVEAGEPAAAIRLLDARAGLPVTASNADANAVLAHALDAMGQRGDAAARANAVLAFDPSNIVALRARTDLLKRAGRADAALIDAQRLAIENPGSAEDRLRLIRAYVAAGDPAGAESTYWDAFRDLGGDPTIYRQLRRYLLDRGRDVSSLDTHYRILRQRTIDRL